QLSVMAFRLDSYPDLAKNVGKDVADQLLARIAKLVTSTLRAEDSIGRAAESTFVVVSTGAGANQVMAFARRLYQQLQNANVAYKGQPLKIVSSFGIAAPTDASNSIEDLMKLALARLQKASASAAERIVGADEVSVAKAATLPSDLDRAVQALEQVNVERLGDATDEILLRLLPFLRAAMRRLKIEFPVERINAILRQRK
ncbi:MAG: diguanylate cyclase, partial [Betaproteobacteria bacterium]|nr:diguanylate cyclase [Betaproteobacteria bacterium]